MIETLKKKLLQHIEKLDETQLQIVLGFVKRILNLND